MKDGLDWIKCKSLRLAKEAEIDKNLATSLQESSNNKFSSASLLELNETTASSIITLFYDSLRELLEAIAILCGYKIYNHECYTYFIKEILSEDEISYKFDGVIKIRNAINYYGWKLSLEDTKIMINDTKELIRKCKSLKENKINRD